MNKKKIIIYSSIVVLILVFIFVNSSFGYDVSHVFSDFFKDLYIKVFRTDYVTYSPAVSSTSGGEVITSGPSVGDYQEAISDSSNYLVRKTGHVSEYLALGIFSLLLLREISKKYYMFIIMPVFVYLVACLDEFNQYFSGGRSASVKDTFIDLSGALVFDIIFFIVVLVIHFNNKKKIKSINELNIID